MLQETEAFLRLVMVVTPALIMNHAWARGELVFSEMLVLNPFININ